MPPPMAGNTHDALSEKNGDVAMKVAKTSMIHAASELKQSEGSDVGVSVDGSWQRREFSSLNGVITAISINSGKILDCEILSRHCKACAIHAPLKQSEPPTYDAWKLCHQQKCQLNYEGSAPSVESTGAGSIFSTSVESYGLRYVGYYGDGDSKSFQKVENIYPGITVMKYECLGHYQKRVGNRLRKLRSKVKGLGGKAKSREKVTTTKDSKIIKKKEVAKSRLTDAMIDMLQNYFGIALRSGAKSVPELKVALLASFFHIASSKTNNFHTYCPETPDSWCQYKRDIINKTNLYKPGPGLADEIIKYVKPEYAKLTNEDDLSRCLHGKTQNANESFNVMIWERAPKSQYCGLSKLKFCVYDAIVYFNYGAQSVLDILDLLDIKAGVHTTAMSHKFNINRKYNAGYKSKTSTKLKRKLIRGKGKRKSDKLMQQEGTTYEPGGF